MVGLFLSQAIGSSGYLQVTLERGFIGGTVHYLKIFPILALMYMSLIYNAFSTGVKKAYKNLADYVATGRRAGRHHYLPFFDTNGYNLGELANKGDLYVNVNQPGIGYIIPAVIIMASGLILWMSPGSVWSFMPVLMALAAILAPFILNAGSTPATTDIKLWASLYRRD
jgi:hypothetical protein